MKIKKYQAGGVAYTPFISNITPATSAGSATSSKTGNDKITGTFKKEIIDILKQNGLPSDVDSFLNSANTFLSNSSSLSDMSLFGGTNDDYDMSDLIKIQSLANRVARNKELYDEAIKNLNTENAWSEVAIDDLGHMYVYDYDKKNMTKISPGEYYKNPENYVLLTNSQLMGLRESQGNMAFDMNSLNNMNKAIGIQTIYKHLIELTEKLGTNVLEGYSSKESNDIFNGAKLLMASGPDGFYKIKDEHQINDINKTLDYFYRQLNPEMKRTLSATVAAEGGDPNSKKDIYSIISSILTEHSNNSISADFDKSATDTWITQNGGSTGSTKMVEQSLPERYASGNGFGAMKYEAIMPGSMGTPIYALSQDIGPAMNKDGKTTLGDANLEVVLNESLGLGGITDRNSITFGDVPVDPHDASKIMYEGGPMKRIYLPVKSDNGIIRPDFELQEKIDELNKKIISEGWTEGQIKNIIKDLPNLEYNPETQSIVAKNTKLFLTFSAVSTTDTYKGHDIDKSKYLHPLTNQEDYAIQDIYNTTTAYHTHYTGAGKEDKTGNKRADLWWGFKFYRGNVFIPITDSVISASIYNNQLVPQDTYTNISAKAEAKAQLDQKQAMTEQLINNNQLKLDWD